MTRYRSQIREVINRNALVTLALDSGTMHDEMIVIGERFGLTTDKSRIVGGEYSCPSLPREMVTRLAASEFKPLADVARKAASDA